MASDFSVGDKVFVPSSRFPELADFPFAFYPTSVVEVENRSIRVNLPDQIVSKLIGAGLCHHNVAIMLIWVGDLNTESTLLDPLSKSILQFCRLLVEDSYLKFIKVRSVKELKHEWEKDQEAYSHVILLGHGSEKGIKFFYDDWVSAQSLRDTLYVRASSKKVFISLCCETGKNNFSTIFSKIPTCSHFIAPFHSLHGVIASQFTQTFLSHHLLDGKTVAVAMRHTIERVPGSQNFRYWEDGKMIDGPKS